MVPPSQLRAPEVAFGGGVRAATVRDDVEPLTADLRRLHITVDAQFLKMLATAKDGLSHTIPGASAEQVLKAALELLLEKQARARGLVKRPRTVVATVTPTPTATANPTASPIPTPIPSATPTLSATATPTPTATATANPTATSAPGAPSATAAAPATALAAAPVSAATSAPGTPTASVSVPVQVPVQVQVQISATATAEDSPEPPPLDFTPPLHRRAGARKHVPATIVREVWQRDGGRCAWPLDGGGVCGSTHRLEIDHIIPWARWGGETVDELRVVCHAHNTLAARQAFGARCVARYARSPHSRS